MSTKRFVINGAALRNTRKLLDIRTEDLAKEVGISYSMLASLENGNRLTASRSVMKKLCVALRIDDPRAIMQSQEEMIDAIIAENVLKAPPLSEGQKKALSALIADVVDEV